MKCTICNNQSNNKSYQIKEMMFGFHDVFTYFECSNCGCLQIAEIPENMHKYYPDNYCSFLKQFNSCSDKINMFKKLRNSYTVFGKGLIGKLLFNIKRPGLDLQSLRRINITRKSKILDVGSGVGILLHTLKNLGFNNLLGIDLYINEDLKYDNDLTILKKSIFDIDGQFDLIMFHHCFEHISNPCETLEAVSKLLNQDGLCLIRIPIVPSFAWKLYKNNWVQLDAPRHFFLFSIESIKLLAKKTGFEIVDILYDSTDFQFLGSELYLKNLPLNNLTMSIFTPDETKKFKRKTDELNKLKQGDQVAIYLKNINKTL
jgi:SAM-dependent methyltransferase